MGQQKGQGLGKPEEAGLRGAGQQEERSQRCGARPQEGAGLGSRDSVTEGRDPDPGARG